MKNDQYSLVIRADANPQIGTGHVMRCLALAQAHFLDGGHVIFAGDIQGQALQDQISWHGAQWVPLPAQKVLDPQFFLNALSRHGIRADSSWMILDGYSFDLRYQKAVKNARYRTLIFDDYQDCDGFEADIVLVQDVAGKLLEHSAPSSAIILAGPRYRLLRREFRIANAKPFENGRAHSRILVCFGGSDSRNITCSVLEALSRTLSPLDEVRVIVGPLNQSMPCLEQVVQASPFRAELLLNVTDMPVQMQWADFAISAGGGTAWELAAMGVPSLLIPTAENQYSNISMLSTMGAALSPENAEILSLEKFNRLIPLLMDSAKRAQMAAAGKKLIDGKGPERILKFIDVLIHRNEFAWSVRPAVAEDAWQVFRIANDPQVRANAFSSDPIPPSGHLLWFAGKLQSPDTALYIMDMEGVAIALVRYDRIDSFTAEIDIAVHPAFRNLSLGPKLLDTTAGPASIHLNITDLRAKVLKKNIASIKCFHKAGYIQTGEEVKEEKECVVLTRKISGKKI